MSLYLDPRTITAVLLSDGKWYPVDNAEFESEHQSNFGFDSYEFGYEYLNGSDSTNDGFKDVDSWLSGQLGFSFISGGRQISGPVTSIQAVEGGKPKFTRQELKNEWMSRGGELA